MPVDIRIVLDWNSLETDMDLWVIDPNGEKCFYSNTLTRIGGRLTEDYVDGYGPEEFLLKKAIKGKYQVKVEYYDDRVQKIGGPVTLKVTIFTNYGKKNEEKREVVLQLDEEKDVIDVATFKWGGR